MTRYKLKKVNHNQYNEASFPIQTNSNSVEVQKLNIKYSAQYRDTILKIKQLQSKLLQIKQEYIADLNALNAKSQEDMQKEIRSKSVIPTTTSLLRR